MLLSLKNTHTNKNHPFVLDFKLIEDTFFMHMMYDFKKKYFKDNKLLRINEDTKVKDLCPFFLQLNFSF